MSTGLTIVWNSFLYYCCLLLLTRYVFNCLPKTAMVIGSFFSFIPLVILALQDDANLLYPAYVAFEIIQFALIKLSFPNVKIRHVIFGYIFLYGVNVLINSLTITILPEYRYHLDYLVNSVTTLLCILLCLTKARYSVHQIFEWTPKYILVISGVLLSVAALTSVLISAFQLSMFPEKWMSWMQVLTAFFLMAICLIVPVIFIISISNTRLKTLTADYEQQIRAQAEHYKKLAEANYEVRRFRHDFKNIRIAIENFLAQGEYGEALALIRQCSDTLENPGGFHPVFDTGNGIADALLTDKEVSAIRQNTHIEFEGAIPQESLLPTDLCVILGNSLDNALDACRKLPEQNRKTISVCCKSCGGFLFISITNPVAEKVTIRNNLIATTKENKTLHGFGLYSLHAIVKKYDGALQLTSTDETFTISIDLCIPKKAH